MKCFWICIPERLRRRLDFSLPSLFVLRQVLSAALTVTRNESPSSLLHIAPSSTYLPWTNTISVRLRGWGGIWRAFFFFSFFFLTSPLKIAADGSPVITIMQIAARPWTQYFKPPFPSGMKCRSLVKLPLKKHTCVFWSSKLWTNCLKNVKLLSFSRHLKVKPLFLETTLTTIARVSSEHYQHVVI